MNLKQFIRIRKELHRRNKLIEEKENIFLFDKLQTTIYDLETEQRRVRQLIRSDLNHIEKWIDE